jgi:hypothetical protein
VPDDFYSPALRRGCEKNFERNLRVAPASQSLKRLSLPWYFISSVSDQYYFSAAEVEEKCRLFILHCRLGTGSGLQEFSL